MSDPTAKTAEQRPLDTDLLAIRDMIRKEKAETAHAKTKPAPAKRRSRQAKAARRSASGPAIAAPSANLGEPIAATAKNESSLIAIWAGGVFRFARRKVMSYRPDRKAILWTSLVLLLLLRPGLVFGWSLVAVLSLLLVYLFMGPDRFWRWVIVRFQRFARRHPEAARRLKCRAYVLARKWDSLLAWAPQGFADQFRSPDLREIIVADRRHAAIMAERLTQLERDIPVR